MKMKKTNPLANRTLIVFTILFSICCLKLCAEDISPAQAQVNREKFVAESKKYVGCPYVYGAAGSSSFDCSGFTMYVYKHFGYELSHSATAQSKKGTYVAKEDLMPGDLVFFLDYETMDGIGHCGIYVGDGNFIHASSGSGYCVKVSTLTSGSYAKRYSTARRLIYCKMNIRQDYFIK